VDAFGYLSVLISIILGLGITQILTGVGRLMQARHRVRLYWPSLVWAALLVVVHVQTWWVMYSLRERREWTFGAFLLVLLQPALLYLLSALVLPEFDAHGAVDLRANYYAQYRWSFGIAVLVLVQSVLRDVLMNGALPDPVNLAAHAAFGVLWGTAAVTGRESYHRFTAVATAVLFGLYVTVLFVRLR
jgi:hypothetical protein